MTDLLSCLYKAASHSSSWSHAKVNSPQVKWWFRTTPNGSHSGSKLVLAVPKEALGHKSFVPDSDFGPDKVQPFKKERKSQVLEDAFF